MLHPLKVISTLADETRFQIYEYMLKNKIIFTVQTIADAFQIHPNVARLHLTKLADIGVITSEFKKTGKGGRPGRIYQATNEGIKLSFPKREESILLKIVLPMIESFGEPAQTKGKEIAYSIGQQDMHRLLKQHKQGLSFEEKCALLVAQSTLIGYIPTITEKEQKKIIHFTIYNCPFYDQLTTHHTLVCMLHEAYLHGQMDALFGKQGLVQTAHMVHSCENCQYEIRL